MHIYRGTNTAELSWARPIFEQRVQDGTATSGPHNYAIDIGAKVIARSNTSAHAEIALIAMSTKRDQLVSLASEYKPCTSCQALFEAIERARGIEIQVVYFLEYENKGDGDRDITRKFYTSYGFLAGGGEYVWSVTNPAGWKL
jgi:hypothetical protein